MNETKFFYFNLNIHLIIKTYNIKNKYNIFYFYIFYNIHV